MIAERVRPAGELQLHAMPTQMARRASQCHPGQSKRRESGYYFSVLGNWAESALALVNGLSPAGTLFFFRIQARIG